MSETFFTGCTHFHHANIIKLANRPFASVEEMDETLIERWNKKVGPTDVVYHLGDVGWFQSSSEAAHLLGKLNGTIVLIQHPDRRRDREAHGNHDAQHISATPYMELSFEEQFLVLFHYPIEDWNGRWWGSIHLHCHTHQPEFRNPLLPYDRIANKLGSRYPAAQLCNRFNVGVDATDFTPVSLGEIIEESRL